MSETSLAVEIREEHGKGAARRLRRAGRIPGVVYGAQQEPVSISLDPSVLDKLIHTSHAGINTLIDLQGPSAVAGKTVLVKELQREPVRGWLLHADLYAIAANTTVRVSIPVHLSGTAHGVTMGGLIDHALREIEIECLPAAIPDEVVIDVSHLDIGDSIHVADLPLPDGVELHTQDDLAVVSVVAPRVEEEAGEEEAEEAAAVAAAAGEGEVPGKGEEADDEGERRES